MSNGLFQSIEECPKCHGQGEFIDEDDQCEQCHGDHLIEEPKEIDIRIERGAEQGDRIVFQGAADEIPDFDTGDVVIVIKEEDHERFQRNHHHLLYKKTLSLTEALYGATFVIEHLDGRKLLVNTNTQETINPGTVQIIENEGMPMKGDSFKKGKLFIEYEIEFPSKEELTPEFQKELFKIVPPVDETKGIDLESENVHKVEPQEGSIEEFESAKKAKKEARREAYRSDDDDDGDNDEGYDGDEDDYDEDDGQGGPGCQPM